MKKQGGRRMTIVLATAVAFLLLANEKAGSAQARKLNVVENVKKHRRHL